MSSETAASTLPPDRILCKAHGSPKDGACAGKVPGAQFKCNILCLSKAKLGLKLVLTAPSHTDVKLSRRCALGLRERTRARGMPAHNKGTVSVSSQGIDDTLLEGRRMDAVSRDDAPW
ncbi:uncharacterized protein LOC110834811 isoform X2 [Zootermopsis nevadensis]|uniref:uncharacterized protein LOC110834811 isoform X2 n=1 Tax=Zootermopsis nevadensis TaxID=136037 RepID=UPI000B8EA014|nr:uncharacterized protein LOC110834811 isoform X2 [Zootermopsis nevadensis]